MESVTAFHIKWSSRISTSESWCFLSDVWPKKVFVTTEPRGGRLESIGEEPSPHCTRLLCRASASGAFAFGPRRILAAGSCGRMMPEVPPRRIVPSLLLNLTLGFTKRALCLRWQDALATDLEKVAKTGCLVRKREAGDVSAPPGTFFMLPPSETPHNPSRTPPSPALSRPLVPLSISVPRLWSPLSSRLVTGGFSWTPVPLRPPHPPHPPHPHPVTEVIHHFCQGGNVCGWVQRSMTSSFEWTSLDWLFFVKDLFRKQPWQFFRWFSRGSQWNTTPQPSIFAATTEGPLWCAFCFAHSFRLAYLHLHSNVMSDLEHDLWCLCCQYDAIYYLLFYLPHWSLAAFNESFVQGRAAEIWGFTLI